MIAAVASTPADRKGVTFSHSYDCASSRVLSTADSAGLGGVATKAKV